MKKKMVICLPVFLMVMTTKAHAAYLDCFPQTITQPDGKMISCFVSGDEYYSWLHDQHNFTIVQDSVTGFYCFAVVSQDKLMASKYIVGKDDPFKSGLLPGAQISTEQKLKIKSAAFVSEEEDFDLKIKSAPIDTPRILNNIVIYIRFSDQNEFGSKQPRYSYYFNCAKKGANSMYNYFKEASFGKLKIISSFFPVNNGVRILSYQDIHPRSYYCPRSAENDSGYCVTDGGVMMRERKIKLIDRAVRYIAPQVPKELNLDSDHDGKVDNVCFIIRGKCLAPGADGTVCLWPHAYRLYNKNDLFIGSKKVYRFTMQIENYLDYKQTGVLCHEMFHTIGGGDLYRYDCRPVGTWDIMSETLNPPQSMCADYKYRYGRWIDSIPQIRVSGHYLLHPITSAQNNCYRMASSSQGEYFMLEFRQKAGTFESSIPSTGLIIYRIDRSECCQNYVAQDRSLNWIYVYRPGGTNKSDGVIMNAWMDVSAGRSSFTNTTDPNCYLSDGSLGNIFIKNIEVCDNTVSFDVRFCNQADEVIITETTALSPITSAMNKIETSGTVIVKDSTNVIFEAGQEIILNPGFEVNKGGNFETNINCCGQQ